MNRRRRALLALFLLGVAAIGAIDFRAAPVYAAPVEARQMTAPAAARFERFSLKKAVSVAANVVFAYVGLRAVVAQQSSGHLTPGSFHSWPEAALD